MIEMDRRKEVFVIILSVLCSGCAVGPNYKKPEVPVPPTYRDVSAEQAGKAEAASFGDEKWWDAFQDEALRNLIQTALKQNYDVQIAATRILQARAQLGIARADQLPAVEGVASATNERTPQAVGRPAIDTSASRVSLSLAWEMDFWGKFRRASVSAR